MIRNFAFVMCLLFVVPCSAQGTTGGSRSARVMPAKQRAMLMRIRVLRRMSAQIRSNVSTLTRHTTRLETTQRYSRTNRAALSRLADAHRGIGQRLETLKVEFSQTYVSKARFNRVVRMVQEMEGNITQINGRLRRIVSDVSAIREGRFSPQMVDSFNKLVGAVLDQTGGVIERLDAIEGRVKDLEDDRVRAGVSGRFFVYSLNRESSTSGFTVGPTLSFSLGVGRLTIAPGVGYGGKYGDDDTLAVDVACEYTYVFDTDPEDKNLTGAFVSAGFYYASTHAFTQINEDVTPTTSQFIGARVQGGYAFDLGYVSAGLLLGNDGQIDLGNDFSVGLTLEAAFVF